MTVRVVFADDNFLVREGVSALLAESQKETPLSERWGHVRQKGTSLDKTDGLPS